MNVAINSDTLDTLADAIASKSSESTPMTLDEMIAAVNNIVVGGGGMNKQIYYGPASVKNNGYIASSATLTVAVTGTYTISWTAWRSSSQGTMGTNLYNKLEQISRLLLVLMVNV